MTRDVRSQPPSRPSERSNLERRRSLPEFSSDRGKNRNLFTQFNSGLPDVHSHGPSGDGPGEITGNVTAQTNERRHSLYASFPYPSDSSTQAQTDNSGDTGMIAELSNRLSWLLSGFQIQTDNSDGTGIPTELKNHLDQLFSGPSELRTIDRPELQRLSMRQKIAEVQNGFKQLSEEHKTKILDTSKVFSLNEIGQILQEGLRLLEDGKFILNMSMTTLEQIDGRMQKGVNRKVQDDIDEWKKIYSNRREPEPGTPYYDINVAKSEKIQLEAILNALQNEKDQTNLAIQDLAFYKFPTAEDYNTLQSNIEETYVDTVKVPLLQYINSLQNQLKEVNFYNLIQKVYNISLSQIDKIDALIGVKYSEWELANALYEHQEQWNGGHPFFLQGDMLDADTTITIPPKEYSPGRGLVHMVSTILSVQHIEVTEELQHYIRQVLGQHPYGGGVSVKHLESQFITAIKSETKYQFRQIEPKDLKTALSTGKPIGAFLDTAQVAITSAEDYYPERTVTLVDIEKNDLTKQDEVIVIDELRTAYNDPSKIVPYRIPVEPSVQIGRTIKLKLWLSFTLSETV